MQQKILGYMAHPVTSLYGSLALSFYDTDIKNK